MQVVQVVHEKRIESDPDRGDLVELVDWAVGDVAACQVALRPTISFVGPVSEGSAGPGDKQCRHFLEKVL